MPSSILNSDDGVISGTSGLKSSGGDDGVLVFQSKGTETARINTDKQIVAAAGTASLPALTTTGDVNTGIFFPAADTIAFGEGGAEAMRINSSGNVGIGTTSPVSKLTVQTANITSGSTDFETVGLAVNSPYTTTNKIATMVGGYDGSTIFATAIGFAYNGAGYNMMFATNDNTSGNPIERMRIDSSGNLTVGVTSAATSPGVPLTSVGFSFSSGYASFTNNGGRQLDCNRQGDDGVLIGFWQANTEEGTISVSGSTVSYNGGHLSRWAQMLTKPDLLKGTVMSNLDEMNVYVDADGNPVENEQLNKVKVSDVEGDANVAGVFVNWTYDEAHQVDEINMAMTGDMIIRIAQGTTVARGDLLMSAGDGTAKPQGDDIVRSKTIAKVTSTHVTCTYDDGSYCVPCVLMAC